MKKLVLFIVTVFILLPHLAFAGAEGHGGMGIYDSNHKLYLVDFMEAGVPDHPKFDLSIPIRPDYLERVENIFSEIFKPGAPEFKMIAQKLSEIAVQSNTLSESLLIGMGLYSWSLVERKVVSPNDDRTPLQHKPEDIVTLAIRRQRAIMISDPDFSLLIPTNRVGLIFHEISFAYVPPQNRTQDSDRAKEFNGMIFSHTLSQSTLLLRSFVSTLNLPFENMTSYIADMSKLPVTIQYNPSVKMEQTFYHQGDSPDVINAYCTKYFPAELEQSFRGSFNLLFASEIMRVEFSYYGDLDGKERDYLVVGLEESHIGYMFTNLKARTIDACIAEATDDLNQQIVKDYFATFKKY